MSGAEVAGPQASLPAPDPSPISSGPRLSTRMNVGADLDRLAQLLPAGAAREFVRDLPRRLGREEMLVCLEALVRLMQADRPQH